MPIVKTREKLKHHRFPASLQSPTGNEDSSAAQAEDAKFEDKRDSSSTQPWMGNRGNPRKHRWSAEEQRSGANRKSVPRHLRRTEAPGRTGARTVGGVRDQRRIGVIRGFSLTKPEGERTGATREVHQLVPEDAVPGRPGHWSSAIPKHRCTGQPGNGLSAPPKHSILGSPRGLIAGKSRKVQKTGKPETCTSRHRETRGEPGQPGTLLTSGAEGCEIRVASKIHRRSQPKDRASG